MDDTQSGRPRPSESDMHEAQEHTTIDLESIRSMIQQKMAHTGSGNSHELRGYTARDVRAS